MYQTEQAQTKTNSDYQFKEIENDRWGIYTQDRLLATIGSYEACKSMIKSLDKNMSYADALKVALAYKKSINRSLSIA